MPCIPPLDSHSSRPSDPQPLPHRTMDVNGAAPRYRGRGRNGSVRQRPTQPHRTMSSPMMPAFMVSAPGKVIVFGEHAVVHGKVCRRPHRRPWFIQSANRCHRRLQLLRPSRCGRISSSRPYQSPVEQ